MTSHSMTAKEKVTYVATKIMGWHRVKARANGDRDQYIWATQNRDQNVHWDFAEELDWYPLTDWNDWRQVEEKVMEDEELWGRLVHSQEWMDSNYEPSVHGYMKADLPTRVSTLISAHQELHP